MFATTWGMLVVVHAVIAVVGLQNMATGRMRPGLGQALTVKLKLVTDPGPTRVSAATGRKWVTDNRPSSLSA
ncbi:hypothetical protein F4780DRAFT_238169 [Xylariomycetidae sp. FL0641]|nr:hypothetical protein F4780DRAFT_238169 [Xylariomycetidae sp. FL0641]